MYQNNLIGDQYHMDLARNFYWEMVFSPTLSEKRPAIKNQFQVKFSQIN